MTAIRVPATFAERRAALVEDVEFMVRTGESLPGAMARLGYRNANSLEVALGRVGRQDLMRSLRAPADERLVAS